MNPQAAQIATRRWPMILIGVLFLGPFFAAYVWYFYFPQARPEGRTNKGELIAPARPIESFSGLDADGKPVDVSVLQTKWSLVQLGGSQCDEACAHRLYLTRQIRTRLNRDARRVQRIYVAPDAESLARVRAAFGAEHVDMVWLVDAGSDPQRLAQKLAPDDGSVYLLDPLANWVLRYPPDLEPADVYEDLKKLLKLSSVG